MRYKPRFTRISISWHIFSRVCFQDILKNFQLHVACENIDNIDFYYILTDLLTEKFIRK